MPIPSARRNPLVCLGGMHKLRRGGRKLAGATLGALALASGGWLPQPALAAIFCCAQNVTPADGALVDMVFVAWDMNQASGPAVAFVKDLGVTMGQFVVSGQQDGGSHSAWWLGGTGDTSFASFLGTRVAGAALDASKMQWAVFGYDATGDFKIGAVNLYTTLTQGTDFLSGPGNDNVITGLSTLGADAITGVAISSVNEWLSAVNVTAGHATVDNGSAVVKATDGLSFPFHDGGPGTPSGAFNLNNNLLRGMGNRVGNSSWFYGVTGSDDDFADSPLSIDEFDNTAHDGYWGLALSTDPAHAGEYLLSYTLQSVLSPTEQVQNVLFGSSFARLAGTLSLASPAGKAGTVLAMTEGFLRGLSNKNATSTLPQATAASVHNTVSAVPEPASWALLVSGAGLLAVLGRRRRAPR